MIVNRIRIDGFKNIDNVDIEFSDITALIGLNNYGKSNVLSSIEYANEFIKEQPDNKEKMMNYISGIPINKNTANRNFNFEIEFSTEMNGDKCIVEYGFEFAWPKNNEDEDSLFQGQIVKEFLKIKRDEKGQKYNIYINRTIDRSLYRTSESGRCDKNIQIEQNNLLINKLNNYDDLYYIDIIKEINNMNFKINSFLDTSTAFRVSPIKLKHTFKYELDPDGENIAEVVFNLKKNDENLFESLKNAFVDLFNDIEEIDVVKQSINLGQDLKLPDDAPFMLTDDVYRIKVKNVNINQYVSFENLSNGTKRIFLLLTSIILANENSGTLIAFEELENCIHPSLFKDLIEYIKKIIKNRNTKVIITSHSPLLVSQLDLDDIYVSIPNKKGLAKFSKIRKSKQKMLINGPSNSSIGNNIFNMLSNYYEDEDDNEIFSILEME